MRSLYAGTEPSLAPCHCACSERMHTYRVSDNTRAGLHTTCRTLDLIRAKYIMRLVWRTALWSDEYACNAPAIRWVKKWVGRVFPERFWEVEHHILAYCTQPMDIAAHCNFVTFHWTNASGCWSFEGNFNSLIVITWELTGSLPLCLMPKCKLISWLHSQKMMKCEHLKHINRLWIYRTANYSIIWEK